MIRFAGICDWPRLTGLVADAGKLRRLSCSQDDFIYFLPVAATSLRAEFQVYLSKLWVVDVTKAVRYDLLIYCLLSDIIFFIIAYSQILYYQSSTIRFVDTLPHFLIRVYSWKCGADGCYRQMWQVSCRRQGMLTQGPAPDPKSKV